MLTEDENQTTDETKEGGQQADETSQAADEGSQQAQDMEQTPVERPSRKDRRQARLDVERASKERDEWKRQFEETNGRYSELERNFAALTARLEEREKQQQAREQQNTYDSQIDTLEKESQRHLQNVAKSTDPEYQQAEMRLYHQKQRQIGRLEDKRDAEKESQGRQHADPQQMAQQTAHRAAARAALDAEYPDLSTNRRLQMRADEHFFTLVAEKKMDPNSIATLRAAVAMAARDLGINGTSAKLPAGNKNRYLGVGGGEGDGDDGSDEPEIRFEGSEREYALARGMFPSLDENEAYRKWKGVMIAEMRGGAAH